MILGYEPIELALIIATTFIIIGATCSFIRLVIGPTLSNRVVALDYLAYLAVAAISLLAIRFDNSTYLDVAIVIALLGFLAVVAFARYVERRLAQGTDEDEIDD